MTEFIESIIIEDLIPIYLKNYNIFKIKVQN